jgi:hypothetical protein
MASYLDVDSWLVKPHRHYATLDPHPDVDTVVCPAGDPKKLERWIKSVDIVLFDETPYYKDLIRLAKFHDKRIVCILAQEWMPFEGQQHVDLFICPNNYAYEQFKNFLPCVCFPWPVDTQRFEFRQREKCERFLFLNGNGGWRGRKGADVIKDTLKLFPDLPLLIRTQKPEQFQGNNIEVLREADTNQEIYGAGDVLLNPSHIDGTGLQPMEAMACGMPVISTSGYPWNEIPAIARIPSEVTEVKIKRVCDWYLPSPVALASICRNLLGTNINAHSYTARQWADSNSFFKLGRELTAIIRGEQYDKRFNKKSVGNPHGVKGKK